MYIVPEAEVTSTNIMLVGSLGFENSPSYVSTLSMLPVELLFIYSVSLIV